MKRIYQLTNTDFDWQCTIAIDEDHLISQSGSESFYAKDIIKYMVEFWVGWETRLEENEGDYIKTFLQQLARQVLYLAIENPRYNISGIIASFRDLEGWSIPDGSDGIELVSFDRIEIEHERFQVEEVENG
ncbi:MULTISPECIES: hypothetical protein [Olivibacter]|uniref:Uncharacterized protein n=1 Tax=Olivibacter jilunii TaxID=985016 RepID=A0ABW6AVW0_9SPHI